MANLSEAKVSATEFARPAGELPREENESDTASHQGFDEKATRRLLRKIDFALLPLLALLYLMSFLDRGNIGNARLAGLERDLKMHGLDFNVALAIFFPFYVLAEIPSNIMMKRFSPSLWIPSIMVVWGAMCCLMGLVHDFAGLLAVRAALGLAEGGLFPGITFYITMWYRRHECGLRMALFFSAATAAGAFGGLLARGIMELDGKRGLSAWSWIFIIEGAITVAVALFAYSSMHDYPDSAKFLTKDEREEVDRRLEADRSYLDDEFALSYIRDAVLDWKIWVYMLITIGIYSPLYSFASFLPTIISNLGYSNETAQLMTVPPYVVACLFCISAGWIADKHGQRGVYMISANLVAIVGFLILIAVSEPKLRYLGTFFAAAGIYPNVSQTVAWNGNNIGGSTKRSVGIAMQVGFGNLGGVLSGFTYTSRDAPLFRRGHGIVIGLLAMSTVLCAFMRWWCIRENARRDAVDAECGRLNSWSKQEMQAERRRGDQAGFFRYTI
ncbi:major facilitator superfamily transporter [Aaosphaeria arxii CBS 175.79]|uniref:Major facilitator superfamily transporter n=1 Tax=Aaosphaeria arxii CBS 175.79 TaxID=1450172 RepID=A0A6A5XSR3_9PLEO|nr:major facilitator superfamily transporter [Aaosphaeria arxii CBS 175.79]KAF2015956.1 major facilitator superfamily transporter [Aaosphaeria arxii CBS 175.79]